MTEIISPDEAVLYSSDAMRAHMFKSEWGDEDDGTWDDGMKYIMSAKEKFTDEDLEQAERDAERIERRKSGGGGGSGKGGSSKRRSGSGRSGGSTGLEVVEDDGDGPATLSSTSFPRESEKTTGGGSGGGSNSGSRVHGDDSEIEGLLVRTSVTGNKYTVVRIDTKHPDLPYRAIYCKAERRWIAMFDHYCGILGTPVGEKNHARFWYVVVMNFWSCF